MAGDFLKYTRLIRFFNYFLGIKHPAISKKELDHLKE